MGFGIANIISHIIGVIIRGNSSGTKLFENENTIKVIGYVGKEVDRWGDG